MHDAGASWAVYDDVRTVVVPHAGGARFDLVVFDPERGCREEPLVVPVEPLGFMGRAVRMGTRSAVVRHLTEVAEVGWEPHPEYAAFTVVEALERFAAEHVFAVAVVGSPGFADVGTWAPRHAADVPGYREPVVVVGPRGPEASVATGADPAIATRRPDVRIYLRHAGDAVGVSRAGVPDSGGGPGRVRGAR
ncbi:hypothetical protein ACFQV2_30665 [Actinokineospora soli]|uniref:Uncharacterized protein n=1 Tax=Actinokineospora soli TaxID=1048753 RepID=A0ABW2TTJ0_9PSEU